MTSSKMLIAAVAAISAVDVANAAGNLRSSARHGRSLGYCGWGCDNGSYNGWWAKARRYCTCDSNASAEQQLLLKMLGLLTLLSPAFFTQWGDRCCNTYTGPCTEGMTELCAQNKLSQQSFSTSELLNQDGVYQGPITLGTAAAHNLPTNMQGVFWLQNQADSSSLVSFATSSDGDGLSVWNTNPGSGRHISVRVGGDRVWSFASKGKSWELVEGIDLVYNFEGTPLSNPTHFNIIPEAQNLGIELSGDFLEWALSFQMDFIQPGTAEHDYPAVGDRPTAVQWARPSKVFGNDAESAYYEIAQVIDGDGKPTAAYDAWVAYNQGGEEWQDGTIWYHSA